MRLKRVNQQVVVIMGASSGIGRATALRFAAKGAKVVVSARDHAGLDSLVAEIRRKRGTAIAVVADVSDPKQVQHVADRAIEELGRIDTWVHVAAVGLWALAEETRPEEFRRVLEVNLLGQVNGAQAALPHLKRNGGALVHVSSIEAKVALPYNSAYAASKHGLAGFIDSLRLELLRQGVPVSVTQILPAGIDTPLFQNALTRLGVEPRPAPPVYEPELVAKAIVYAAAHPVRELVVGGSGVGILLANRLSPRLVDQILLGPAGFESQLTHRPKSDLDVNNLEAPAPDGNLKVRGVFGNEARSWSILTRLQETMLARIVDRVMHLGQRAAARIVNALFVLRFRRVLPGIRLRAGGEGAGLPVVVQPRGRRETREQASKHEQAVVGAERHEAQAVAPKQRAIAPKQRATEEQAVTPKHEQAVKLRGRRGAARVRAAKGQEVVRGETRRQIGRRTAHKPVRRA